MAEPARQMLPEEAPQEAPKTELPSGPMDLNEALTGRPTPPSQERPSLRELETQAAERGHEILTGKKMEFDKDIEKNTSLFKDAVSSWWNKTKSIFSRSKNKGGEEEIASLEKKAEALKADYAKKAEAAVAPDNVIDLAAERAKREGAAAETKPTASAGEGALDEALARGEEMVQQEIEAAGGMDAWRMKQKEAQLSAEYDRLAADVAKEGADESKAWKKALKTGEEPEMTAAGKRLNQVYKELNAVRAEAAKPKPEAKPDVGPMPQPAPQEAEPEEEPFTPEELAELKAGGETLAREKRIADMGERVDAAMAAEDEQAAMEAVASLEKDAAAEKMAERQGQWDADKSEHERQRNEKLAARDAAEEKKPASPRETYPNLPTPEPGSPPPGVPLPPEKPSPKEAPAPETKPAAKKEKEPASIESKVLKGAEALAKKLRMEGKLALPKAIKEWTKMDAEGFRKAMKDQKHLNAKELKTLEADESLTLNLRDAFIQRMKETPA